MLHGFLYLDETSKRTARLWAVRGKHESSQITYLEVISQLACSLVG